jgi:YD repeat-containing protein
VEVQRRSLGRTLGYLLVFVALLALAAVPALADSSPEAPEALPAAAEIPAPSPTELAEAEIQERERAEWLESPGAEAQREASQTAYAGLSSGEAQSLLLEAFPEQLSALNEDPARVISGLQLEKPLGTYGALISEPDGEKSILESSVPVESEVGGDGKAPVDLSLEPSGEGFAPANPLTKLELPASAEGTVRLHEGLGIQLPTADDHEAVLLGEENLFIPETDPSTDTLLSPVAGGVEISEQLRSSESPEEFSFELQLPKGATLEATDHGGAEVLSADGATIEEIPPPSASDAQGVPVPTQMTVVGESLVVTVPQRGESEFAYPILVDPEYLDEPANYGAWGQDTSGGYGLRNLGGSLNAYSESYRLYGANTHSQWVYTAPGETAYIAAATFNPVQFFVGSCYTAQPHGYIGLYNVSSGAYDSLGVYSGGNSTSEFQTGWVGGASTRDAMIGIGSANESVAIPCYHELYVEGYTIQEKAPYPPSVWVSGVPSGWFDPASAGNATTTALDTGFGVHEVVMQENGKDPVYAPGRGCSGLSADRCPREVSWTEPPPYSPGERTLQVTAENPLQKVAVWSQTTKVDTEAPEIELEGQFAKATEEVGKEGAKNPASENQLSLPTYNLKIKATDGNNSEAVEKQSGVKNVEVLLDGIKQTVSWKPQECPASSCAMQEEYQLGLLGLEAGEHSLKVVAEDEIGHRRPREIKFEYIPATGTENQRLLQHFPLDGGTGGGKTGGAELEVNVMDGNLVFHQKDVDIEGPSADLEVERFYNSELPKELSSEWGTGWTLAQTPVLEPEETKGSAPPATAAVVAETGAVQGAVALPTETGATRFDPQLQAAITKEPGGGYEVTDETGESAGSLSFDEAGQVEELRTSEYAGLEYGYEGGNLSEIAVEDPASAGAPVEEVAREEEERLLRITPTYQSSFGSTGTANGQFKHPAAVAVDAKGNLWVLDKENSRVEEFSESGEFITKFGSSGTANGQFKDPASLALDPSGDIWVNEVKQLGAGRAQEFSPTGEYIRKITTEGEGIAVDPAGHVWVSETYAGKLKEYSATGELIKSVGSKGSGAGQLGEPEDIAFGPTGNLFVADWQNSRVEEFSGSGEYIRQFGSFGTGDGQFGGFGGPYAIAVDSEGEVWVADPSDYRVEGFTETGEYLTRFGSEGTADPQFSVSWPFGIAADAKGDVWVTNPASGTLGAADRVERWTAPKQLSPHNLPVVESVPSVEVDESAGLVADVETSHGEEITYTHEGQLLSTVSEPEGKTTYEYDSSHRLKKVKLPDGSWGEIAYESLGRVKSVSVSIEGGKAKTTNFAYSDEPRETTVSFETEPTTHYQIAEDGSVFKWWNAKVPPEIEELTGSLYTQRGEVHPEPVSSGDQELRVVGHSFEGIASIQIVANGDQLVAEKNCEESKCVKLEKTLVTETEDWPPGVLQLEVIVTDRLGQISAERLWDNIPYTPPPNPEEITPPKFSEILRFREEFGLDPDIKGNENALDERIFDLIAAWHDPNTPDGEVARATDERWGVPLRPQDVAELEYRESFYDADVEKIEKWVEETEPADFGGYYLDNRAGGIMHVGFLGDQEEQLNQMKSSLGLVAPERIKVYPTPPTVSYLSGRATAEEVVETIESSSTLTEEVVSVREERSGTALRIGTPDVAQVESELRSAVPGASMTIEEEAAGGSLLGGRFRTTGRMRAGDGIFAHAEIEQNFEKIATWKRCTAGFGAKEKAGEVNGQATWRLFFLTAGHCTQLGQSQNVFRADESFPPKDFSTMVEVGEVKRTGYRYGGEPLTMDASAVRVEESGIVPQGQWSGGGQVAPTQPAGTVHVNNTVCFNGATSEQLSCGQVTEITKYWAGAHDGYARAGYWVKFSHPAEQGDSGAPVWSIFGPSIGIVDAYGGPGEAHGRDETFVEPLLTPPGLKPEKVYGALTDPHMRPLSLKIAGDGS